MTPAGSDRAGGDRPPLGVLDLTPRGPVPYLEVHELQRRLHEERASDLGDDLVILVEHEPVVTLGRGTARADARNPARPAVIDPDRFPIIEVERGGEATWHGPGQLVAYPIVRLGPDERDLHRLLRSLEEAVIAVAGDFGVAAGRRAGATGVWVGQRRKLASIGIAVARWVTWHGIGLNVSCDLAAFGAIHPCGFDATEMTSLARELGDAHPTPSVGELGVALAAELARELGRSITLSS